MTSHSNFELREKIARALSGNRVGLSFTELRREVIANEVLMRDAIRAMKASNFVVMVGKNRLARYQLTPQGRLMFVANGEKNESKKPCELVDASNLPGVSVPEQNQKTDNYAEPEKTRETASEVAPAFISAQPESQQSQSNTAEVQVMAHLNDNTHEKTPGKTLESEPIVDESVLEQNLIPSNTRELESVDEVKVNPYPFATDSATKDSETRLNQDLAGIAEIKIVVEDDDDSVFSPQHYNQGGIECIEALQACMSESEYIGFLKGNAIKYLWRMNDKATPQENLKKARWYIDTLLETFE